MEIAMGALGPLLPKLGELLVGEYYLEKRVRKGIESLVRELTFIQAALLEVAKVPAEQLGKGVKVWAGNVKELSYEMEDIIDAFMVRVENGDEPADPKNRVKKFIKRTTKLFKKGKDLHGISDAIEEAVGQAKELAELRRRYEFEMRTTGAGDSIDPRMAALYTDVTELVGIDEKRDELMAMLTEGDDWSKRPLKTVSIVGFGGLGKTTLAKTVYDKIKVQFDCTAFVSVSRNPDMRKVLKDILYELDKIKYTNIDPSRDAKQLIDMLVEFLKDKRYLIIIDDIWDEDAWRLIKCAFSNSSPGSRLITTTRIASVSEACCSSGDDDIYKMKPLSHDVSRSLFYKRIFSPKKDCPSELVQVSDKILKKCGGIPLAIITMASLLAINRQTKTKEQWYSLLNSIGHGLTQDRNVEDMKKILLLSYYDLPSYLKPCLLYLSIFPEDHEIMIEELIWRWIAEGFVHNEEQETSLYELGETYFNELVNRSLIQLTKIDYDESVKACRVHDMILDLICSLSREENFITILDGIERKVHNLRSKVRRLSIQKSNIDVPVTSMPQVRSLIAFTYNTVYLVPLISSFEVLRVLDLEGGLVSDLVHVGNLLHLRYLRLKNTNVCELPIQIGKLRFLQTMDLREAKSIKELPSSLVRLRRLICLHLHSNIKLPSGMDKMTSLEVLDGLMVGQLSRGICNLDIVKELGYLTKLRVLKFTPENLDDGADEALLESLKNLHKLQCLDIVGGPGRVDLMREGWVPPPQLRKLHLHPILAGATCSFVTLPTWVNPSSLPLLSNLTICLDEPRPDDIRLLGMLPSLRFLWLRRGWRFSGKRLVEMSAVTADAFPCAIKCDFFGIAAVPSIFPQGAAPRLRDLYFSVPAMWISRGDIDLGMRHLPSLEDVVVYLFREEASDAEVEKAAAAVRAAADDHPNRPTLHIYRC